MEKEKTLGHVNRLKPTEHLFLFDDRISMGREFYSKNVMSQINRIKKISMTYFKDIEQIICQGEGVEKTLLYTKTRKHEIVLARQLVMYFLRKTHGKRISWARTAGFYRKDHATAMHAVKTVNNLKDTEKPFAAKLIYYTMMVEAIIEKAQNIEKEDIEKIKKALIDLVNKEEPITYDMFMAYNFKVEKLNY